MPNAKPLVTYLKTDRRERIERELKKNTTAVIFVDANYNSDTPKYADIQNNKIGNLAYYKTVASHIRTIYLEVVDNNDQPESLVYYEAKTVGGTTKYRNFLNLSFFEEIDVTGFLVLNNITDAYYDNNTNRVILANPTRPAILYQNTFDYHMADVGLSIGAYTLDYKDHEGYTNGFLDNTIKGVTDNFFKNYIDRQKRKVIVKLCKASGKVHLYPFINLSKGTVKYIYAVEDHLLVRDIKNGNTAISLEFNSLHAILAYLNQTIFFDKDIEIKGYKGVKQNFFDDFDWQITGIIRAAKRKINDLLTVLYYTPSAFIKKAHHVDLWKIVGTMLKSNLTNIGLNKEDIILKILEVLSDKYKNKTYFLIELLNNNVNDDSYFYLLYNKLNTTNFVAFNDLIKDIWLQSDFAKPDNSIFLAKKNGKLIYDGVRLLPYKSDKTLGFYHSNVAIEWEGNNSKMVVKKETGEYKTDTQHKRKVKETIDYTYHPFQPIFIKDVATQKTDLKLDYKIPAFYLKAVEDKKTVANIYTSIEYAVDIATTLSGIGNLAKLRHITKLTKLGKAINYARKGAAVIEITSGATNALLKLTDLENTKYGKALSEYLFYLEMLSLSVDATDWISKGLKKSAKEVLEHSDALEKHLDELVEKGKLNEIEKAEVLEGVRIVAGKSKKAKSIWHINRNIKSGEIKGSYNCANCALAVDKTLSDYPVSAVPYTIRKRWKNGKFENYTTFNKGTNITVLEKEFGKKFINNMPPNKIKKILKNGQRGIVYGWIKEKPIAHVFNVVNEGGVIKFLDGQSGKKANLIYDVYKFLPTNF